AAATSSENLQDRSSKCVDNLSPFFWLLQRKAALRLAQNAKVGLRARRQSSRQTSKPKKSVRRWIKSDFFVICWIIASKSGCYEKEEVVARGEIKPPTRGFSVLLFP